jgi:2-iminobutanoate/2-iminopropanoate deaminase
VEKGDFHMEKKIIATTRAPQALGPYVQAVQVNGMLFASGMLGLDPATGELPEGVEAQAHQALRNVGVVLEEAGLDYSHVVKTTVFVKNLEDFATVNGIYATYFKDNYPARSCVEVARIPKDALVEIEIIAVL